VIVCASRAGDVQTQPHRRPGRLAGLVALSLAALLGCGGGGAPRGIPLEAALAADWGELEHELVTEMPEAEPRGGAFALLHGCGASGP
jgi:hypothetical protein